MFDRWPDLILPAHTGTVLQGAGVALLTIALLVLMRTRWGQANPLSKCIVLSVLAHVLLLTYAYGTKLITEPLVRQVEPPVKLTVLEDPETTPPVDKHDPDEQPWNRFPREEWMAPAVETADRQTLDATPAVVADSARQPQFHRLPVDDLPPRESETQHVVPPAPERSPHDVSLVRRHAPGTAQPEADAPRKAGTSRPVVPTASALPRQVDPGEMETAGSSSPVESAPDDLVAAPPLQRLTNIAVTSERAEATDGQEDATRASANQQPAAGRAPLAEFEVAADLDPARLAAPRRLGDGGRVPTKYRLRQPQYRPALARHFGGDEQTEQAVNLALRWLAAQQRQTGHWDASRHGGGREGRNAQQERDRAGIDADTGITGLALLAFLGAGHTHLEGAYRQQVQRGLEYLISIQREDGSLAGRARLYAQMYCHGMATLALSETLAMTGDRRLEPYTRRALQYTIQTQHPTTGGWRYQAGDRGDMSQFGWQVMALKSGEQAGVAIPAETTRRMIKFLQSVSSGTAGGLASYRRGERTSRTMTAEALMCRFLLERPSGETTREASAYLLEALPGTREPNYYYWYYAALALYQAQGADWQTWNAAMSDALVRTQHRDGAQAGSWDTESAWGGYGGRVYTTAMATLCLEVYYRYAADPPTAGE